MERKRRLALQRHPRRSSTASLRPPRHPPSAHRNHSVQGRDRKGGPPRHHHHFRLGLENSRPRRRFPHHRGRLVRRQRRRRRRLHRQRRRKYQNLRWAHHHRNDAQRHVSHRR